MKKLLLATLLATSFNASAGIESDTTEVKLIVGFGSYHLTGDDAKYLNQVNPSIGIELWDLQAVYVSKNSWNAKSLYFTYAPDYKVNNYVSLSANIGFATGYSCDDMKIIDKGVVMYENKKCSSAGVIPLIGVSAELSPFGNNYSALITITPEVIMFGATYKF